MDDIKAWLNSKQPYGEGVQLFLKYSRDKLLRSLFTKEDESAFKRTRLKQALKELYDNYKHPATPKAAIQRIVQQQDPVINYKHWPPLPITDPVLKALHEKWLPVYKELMDLQSQAYEVALSAKTDSTRRLYVCQVVHRILDLDDECDEIYAQRDYYYINGHLPARTQEFEIVGDPVRQATRLKSCERMVREYIIKTKKDPTNVRWAQKLKHYQDQVVQFRKLLKLDE